MDRSLTVLMAVHNGGDYLRTAIDSILSQTYSDFRFLIVDDASTDDTKDIIASYQDDRIQLVSLEKNVGQTAALNIGLQHVTSAWIARMDADDYSAPERLEEQMGVIDSDPSLACVGTFAWMFQSDPETVDGIISNPVDRDDIKQVILGTPLVHGSVLISRDALSAIGGYDERYKISQDVDLFDRLLERYPAVNIPKPLLGVRQHPGQASRSLVALNENVELSSRRLDSDRYTNFQRGLIRGNLSLAYFIRARHYIGKGNLFLTARDMLKGITTSPGSTIRNAVRVFGIEMLPASWRARINNILGRKRRQDSGFTSQGKRWS